MVSQSCCGLQKIEVRYNRLVQGVDQGLEP